MMTITYQDIHTLLTNQLGFVYAETTDRGPRGEKRTWRTYRHPTSSAFFVFAKKSANEPALHADLESLRAHLDYRGLMNAEAFNRFVNNGATEPAT